MTSASHIPIMLHEVVQCLRADRGGIFLDCTFGEGGHTAALLAAHPETRVVAIDRDLEAIRIAEQKFAGEERFEVINSDFSGLSTVLKGRKFDGLLADLGLSTLQIFSERGFSFQKAQALDMRQSQSASLTADTVVNNYSERDLVRVFQVGGAAKSARLLARAIIKSRPIKDTAQLANICRKVIPERQNRKSTINPATVPFQAVRMEVNKEIKQIQDLLDFAPTAVSSGGRLAVITFHSIEDKLVAGRMRIWAGAEKQPASWRGVAEPEDLILGKLVEKRAVLPSADEIEVNPRARSARLRVFEFN